MSIANLATHRVRSGLLISPGAVENNAHEDARVILAEIA
jgi:hypothetical protein